MLRRIPRAAPWVGLLTLAACADDFGNNANFGGTGSAVEDAGADSPRDPSDDGSGGGEESPAEMETELRFERPAVGRRHVYTLNPASDRVAVVNARSFATESVEVGRTPDFAVTVPGEDVAVVLNVGSESVSILRTGEEGTRVEEVSLGVQANRLAMSPDGAHVIAYFDTRVEGARADSFQDVAVVSLAEGEEASARVTVGFRPSRVQFAEDGEHAFLVTEDGISVIVLEEAIEKGGGVARLVGVGDSIVDAVSTDVSVTPDGRHALARRDGASALRLIDLETSEVRTLELASLFAEPGDDGEDAVVPEIHVTDADLSPDGRFALVVVRSEATLLWLPIPGAFEDASAAVRIPLEDAPLIGSAEISADGTLAAAYTTADPDVESVTLVELTEPFAQHGVRLRKAVSAVAFSDDTRRLLVLHAAREGAAAEGASEEDDRIDRSEGYSIVDVETRFAKLQLTDARPGRDGGFAMVPDSSFLFVMLRDDSSQVRELQQVDLASLSVRTIALSAPPTNLGLVPDVERAFVGQAASGGMLTFVHWPDDTVRTVTGFELSSRIRP